MRPDGYMRIQSAESDKGRQEWDTIWCPHCTGHFRVVPGSGTQRGWCSRCGAPTCGKPQCVPCVPFMKQVDEALTNAERLRGYGLGS